MQADLLSILKLKWWILRNKIFGLKRESRLKIVVITLFILGYAMGTFWVLLEGFRYVDRTLGIGYYLIDRLFYVFFMVLFFMLITSQIIITYSTFYKSSEIEFLFSLPVEDRSIYITKFLETTFLSSWAFMFLAVPLFLAYGVGRSLPIHFYITGVYLSVPFVFISAGIGTSLAVLLIRFFPRRFLRLLGISALIIGVGLLIYYRKAKTGFNWQSADLGLIMDQLLTHTKISLSPILPSYWLCKGLFSFISRDWSDAVFYFLVLLSSGMFFVWLCIRIGDAMYKTGWQLVKAGHRTRLYIPRVRFGFLNRWRLCSVVSKDIKIFLRDPVQWSQFAIFFGMMGVYIFNLRNMQYDFESPFWKNLITYLNLGTIALTLGTLATRFIYPQMSLECKRLWIIGLTPIGMGKILFTKYIVSMCFCSIITVGLIIGSNIMLRVPKDMYWLTTGTMFLMSLCLPGLALGLGAIFPNLKEDDMAHIVAGFGGTLTLILSLAYILCMMLVVVILKWAILMIGLSIVALVLPLLLGYKNLLKLEV